MTRQEKRGMADLRHRDRDQRLRKLLAAQPQTTKNIDEAGQAFVISAARGLCVVTDAAGERSVRCDLPVAPGDEVAVRHEKVVAIGTRRSSLSRSDPGNPHRELVIAANVDLLVIVTAMAEPPFRAGLIDRYLIAAARGGVRPLLCVNKMDLCQNTLAAEVFRIPVVRCSTVTGQGIAELRDLMAGSLAVLAGHSGTGKSSLLHALTGEEVRTGAVSVETGKGRHTTTASRVYALGNGGRVIDTPGIRELGLGAVTRAELAAAFPEFTGMGCRFADCLHLAEPDCAVRGQGGARYAAWRRMAEELD